MADPKNIAVLGGGLAGLTTAYELANRCPDCKITVYQMGWRLGGKVASSRNVDHSMRIEEHGIHILFGAYENAFHLLRRAYGDIGENWQDAFVERSEFTVMEDLGNRWKPWHLSLQRNPGDPGDLLFNDALDNRHAMDLAADVLTWLRERVLEYFDRPPLVKRVAQWFFGATLGRAQHTAACVCEKEASDADATADAKRLLWHLRGNLFLLRVIGWLGHILFTLLRPFLGDALQRRDNLRRLWIAAELGTASAAGLTRAALDERSIDDLDVHDLTEWLGHNGVLGAGITKTSARSAPLRMVYEVVFAYEGGDPEKPRLAAGTGLRDLLRLLFDRRGALAYTMRAGSSESMIVPLYRALLKKSNVSFEFFHRIDRLELSADKRRIEKIHFTRQAQPKYGTYDPLIGDGVLPDRPKYDQLVDGDKLAASEAEAGGRDLEMPGFTPPTATTGTLEHGSDFDTVVLAIPVDALRKICEPLAAHDPRWHTMFENSKTTSTQSVQLWFDKSAKELGWAPTALDEPAILGGYAQPFGNWCDLSITLQHERWKAGGPTPQSVAYLCGPLAESKIVADAGLDALRAQVRETCQAWLADFAPHLWPSGFKDRSFDFARLISLNGGRSTERYSEQFFKANINPSDRYTLTLPGTTRHRLAPHESGFDDLYLAGDWTANGFDVGAVEAAVMSGRLAARAVLGLDRDAMPIYGETRRQIARAAEPHRRHEFIRPTAQRSIQQSNAGVARAD